MTLIESQKTPSTARFFESSPGDGADSFSSLKARWIHRRLLKGPALSPVFFVGESPSRALPMALATMRGSIDGIWASSLHKVPLRGMNELMTELRTRLEGYGTGTDQYVWDRYHQFERHVLRKHDIDFSEFSTILKRLFLQIDATKLHEDDMKTGPQNHTRPPTANIWFQCPWVLNGDLSRLLKDFVTSASKIQHYGDVIFLGLTSHPRYRDRYKLEESKFWQHTRQLGYDRCVIQGQGVDTLEPDQKFIQECIKFGYRHSSESSENIHAYIRDYHVTHVLIKRTRLGGGMSIVKVFFSSCFS
ncbi:hypothetical protein C8Q75DRAFT_784502 [Abortiporus biennis]|nr:hypothetical protein C8Q75DRAFT_784502 [Abortiporus biennis]